MYKKIGLIIGFWGFLIFGCEDNNISKSANLNKVQRCINSGGVFNFNEDSCVCNEIICSEIICDDEEYGYVCDDNFKCAKCEEGEKRCTFECSDCDNDKTDCNNDKLEECKKNCKYEYFVKTCQSGNWKREDSSCKFGCDETNFSCFECDDKEQSPMCFAKKDESICKDENDNTSSASTGKKDGNIYQCVNGYYELKETCAYGCSNAKCDTPECIEGDTECIEEGNKAIVRTCKDGFWPQKCNEAWDETAGLVEIHENKICNSAKTHAVDCNTNRCFSKDEWSNLACEDYKAIVMAHIKQLDGLQKESLTQINSWFEISIKINSETIQNNYNLYDLCNFDKTEIKTDITDDDVKNMVNDYNNMYCDTDTIILAKCKEFVEKYMCETNNPSEYSALFTIKPLDAKGAIINCNSNYEWDVSNITPCFKPEYTYVNPENGQENQPSKYNIIFIPKTCADPLEGSKYSNACAINDKD